MRREVTLTMLCAALLVAALALMAQAPAAKPAASATPAPTAAQIAAEKAAAQQPMPEMGVAPVGKTRFEGTLANTGGRVFLGGWFDLTIEKWSTPQEGVEMAQILAQGGEQKLLEKVWKMKQIGFLQVENSMGKPIFFARAIPVPGGLVVRALTNAPLSVWGARAQDYPFAYVEIVIPNGQKGHGIVIGMANIGFTAQGTIQVEAYGTIPIKIQDIGIEKKKK